MLSVRQEARMWILKNIFGRELGGHGFLTRLNISFGELVMTLCQLWAISFAGTLHPPISVNFANSAQKIRCMPSGIARMLRVLGAQSNAFTNQAPPNPWIFVTYSLGFCRFRKITERRCLLYQLGSCGIGETLSILADRCTLQLPILQQWRPLEQNQHKVNFDAAIFRATNSAGIGVVVETGEVNLLSRCLSVCRCLIPLLIWKP